MTHMRFAYVVLLLLLPQTSCITLLQTRAALTQPRPPQPAPTYYWSSGRGSVGSYGVSPFPATINVSEPTWTWHDPKGTYAAIPVGTAIDDRKNIYMTDSAGLHKFSPDGALLWRYERQHIGWSKYETISKACALMSGVAYGMTTWGRAFAVSMDTGREIWSSQVSNQGSDGNYGQVVADGGVVITAVEESSEIGNRTTKICCGTANRKVVGLNGLDGTILWTYTPRVPVWNFGASFVGDGTFIFQDLEGTVHRNNASDGSLVWRAGGIPESWTDGQANLGSNGVVYGVSNYGNPGDGPGCISAHRVSDGHMLWRHDTAKSPNSIPAVGMLAGQKSLSVVIATGVNDRAGEPLSVLALDAGSGAQQWLFNGPTQTVNSGLGDSKPQAVNERKANHIVPMTMPNSWGTPAIDGKGTVYVGGTTGHFFSLEDANGDGTVDGPDEVGILATATDFVGSSGPAIAPGLLAIGNANSLMVWKY